jgi:hypothetical protein
MVAHTLLQKALAMIARLGMVLAMAWEKSFRIMKIILAMGKRLF